MEVWSAATMMLGFFWLVGAYYAVLRLQDRIFFRHYKTRVGPLPVPYDEAHLIRSAIGRGSPWAARRTVALRTPIGDPWLDRRRRIAEDVHALGLFLILIGFMVIGLVCRLLLA